MRKTLVIITVVATCVTTLLHRLTVFINGVNIEDLFCFLKNKWKQWLMNVTSSNFASGVVFIYHEDAQRWQHVDT